MKKRLTWFLLFQKRILKKPMFQATLLLIPAVIILLTVFKQKDTSFVNVALYVDKSELSVALKEELLSSNNQVIRFYDCNTPEDVRKAVLRENAECGYIISDGLVIVVNKESSVSTKVINEIVCVHLFSQNSYKILEEFMIEKHPEKLTSDKSRSDLKELFDNYREPQMMFYYEYVNGQENQLLNLNSSNNYYMMPVRGILATFIMIAAMGGVLMLANDDRKGTWQWITLANRPGFHYSYLLMTIFSACLISLIAIFFTGLSTNILTEFVMMLSYALLVTGFCNLLRILIRNTYVLCSLIPVSALISLVAAPVFVDLHRMVPGLNIIRLFVPSAYYLNAVYSFSMQIKLFLAAVLFSGVSIALDYYHLRKE